MTAEEFEKLQRERNPTPHSLAVQAYENPGLTCAQIDSKAEAHRVVKTLMANSEALQTAAEPIQKTPFQLAIEGLQGSANAGQPNVAGSAPANQESNNESRPMSNATYDPTLTYARTASERSAGSRIGTYR